MLTIVLSAMGAGYESITRLLHPQPVQHLWAVTAAAVLGFLGNEAVAIFRIKVGREIGSAALVADGYRSGDRHHQCRERECSGRLGGVSCHRPRS